MLNVSELEGKEITLHPEPFPVEELYRYIEAVVRPLIREKNQKLEFEFDVERDYLPLMDKQRSKQILFNLLSNAVKFTPEEGTITCGLHESMTDDGRMSMKVTVSDTGIGIRPEYLPHIFEAFSQDERDDSSEARGSGLGLYIAKKFADQMGGAITAESQPGKGTTFSLYGVVDCVSLAEYENTVRDRERTETDDGSVLTGKHILICEDHPINQEIAIMLLTGKHMTAELAENGQRGVELFSGSPAGFYSAVLMDIRMPVMDGIEATAAIRALDRPDAKSVPIIAMTADAFADDIQRCLDAGMNGHITKPIDPEKLIGTLKAALGGTHQGKRP